LTRSRVFHTWHCMACIWLCLNKINVWFCNVWIANYIPFYLVAVTKRNKHSHWKYDTGHSLYNVNLLPFIVYVVIFSGSMHRRTLVNLYYYYCLY
jgi:hypothetical protein